MPRSIQELVDHPTTSASRFEAYEPGIDDERPLEEHLLERATKAGAYSERRLIDAVTTARGRGMSWSRIGQNPRHLGRAVRQRDGAIVDGP